MISTLAMADAVTKLLIKKGLISEAEFKEQLLKERATYQTLLHKRKAVLSCDDMTQYKGYFINGTAGLQSRGTALMLSLRRFIGEAA